jgi:hypothetical protein
MAIFESSLSNLESMNESVDESVFIFLIYVMCAYIPSDTSEKDNTELLCEKHVLTNDFELHKYTCWRVRGHLTLVPPGVTRLNIFDLKSPVLKPDKKLRLATEQ